MSCRVERLIYERERDSLFSFIPLSIRRKYFFVLSLHCIAMLSVNLLVAHSIKGQMQ